MDSSVLLGSLCIRSHFAFMLWPRLILEPFPSSPDSTGEISGCSPIGVTLEVADGELSGVVEDDGGGFDPEEVGKATPSWGVGLRSMRERAEKQAPMLPGFASWFVWYARADLAFFLQRRVRSVL